MRSVLLITAVLLGVIGSGVAITAATEPASPTIACASVQACLDALRAIGTTTSVLIPTDRSLRFEEGWVYPVGESLVDDHPLWGMRLEFDDPAAAGRRLEWVVDSWAAPPDCGGFVNPEPEVDGSLTRCWYFTDDEPDGGGGYVSFFVGAMQYFGDDAIPDAASQNA